MRITPLASVSHRILFASLFALALIFSLPRPAHADNTGLVGYWSFDEGTGSVAQITPATAIPAFPGGTPSTYWEALLRGDSDDCFYNPVIVSTDGASIRVSESGCSNAGDIGTYPVTPGTWNQIVVTRSGQTASTYLNGILKTTINSVPSPNCGIGTDGGRFLIGAEQQSLSSSDGFYNGAIDDVRIYNRALSASEVNKLYKLGTVTIHPN